MSEELITLHIRYQKALNEVKIRFPLDLFEFIKKNGK